MRIFFAHLVEVSDEHLELIQVSGTVTCEHNRTDDARSSSVSGDLMTKRHGHLVRGNAVRYRNEARLVDAAA